MPRFGNTISGLQQLSSSLDSVTKSADAARNSVGGVKGDIESMNASIEQSKSKTDAFTTRTERLRDDAAKGKESLDVLGRLVEANNTTTNDFSEKFNLFIESVRIGAGDVGNLLTQMGDARIVIDGEIKTIREIFSGADLGKYRQEIQELVVDISREKTTLGEVIEFIDSRAGSLAKGLVNVLRLFQDGRATLEEVQRALQAARDAFPPGEIDGLLDGIENGLADGTLGGPA